MGLIRTNKRASTKEAAASETVKTKLEKAYVLPAELGDNIKGVLLELPMKFSQLVGPVIDALNKSYRSDVTLNIPKDMIAPVQKAAPAKQQPEEPK